MQTGYTVTTEKGEFTLVRESFPNTEVSMYLPDFLTELSDEEINQAFPLAQRPVILKSNTEKKVVFVANMTPVNIPSDIDEGTATLNLFSEQAQALSRLTPGFHDNGARSKKIAERTVVCLEYASYALEDDMYNLFFLFVHGGNMIYGTFSCLFEEQLEMNLVFLACLDSLQFRTPE